jgi:hypothetical protein
MNYELATFFQENLESLLPQDTVCGENHYSGNLPHPIVCPLIVPVVSPTTQELTLVIIRRMCPSVRMGQDHLHPLRQLLQRQGRPKERPPRAHLQRQRQPPGKQRHYR